MPYIPDDLENLPSSGDIVPTYNDNITKLKGILNDLIAGTVNFVTSLTVIAYDVGAAFISRRANGSAGSETGLVENDYIQALRSSGYGDTGYSSPQSWLGTQAAEDWTDTEQGTRVIINTTPTGATVGTEKMRIGPNGGMIMGAVADPDPSCQIDMRSATRGLGLPAMSTGAIAAISSPRDGLVAYDSTVKRAKFYGAPSWYVMASASVATQTIYVNLTSGNDTTGDGSSGAPYLTIQKAIDTLPDLITKATVIYVSGAATIAAGAVGDFTGKLINGGSLTIEARDTSGNALYDDGLATSGASTTVTQTGKAWATNFWTGARVIIYTGTGYGQVRDIVNNTATELTVSSAWTTNPDSTSRYAIIGAVKFTLTGNTTRALQFNDLRGFVVRGFWFYNGNASYDIATNKNANGTIEYCCFDGLQSGLFVLNSNVTTNFNCYITPASQFGIVNQGCSILTNRKSVHMGRSGTQGTGVYSTQQSTSLQAAGASASAFVNLVTAQLEDNGGLIVNAASQNFSGCTTNYTKSDADFRTLTALTAQMGTPSPATSATTGFFYKPVMAGAPSGVPSAVTGMVAEVWDSTNFRLSAYMTSWAHFFSSKTPLTIVSTAISASIAATTDVHESSSGSGTTQTLPVSVSNRSQTITVKNTGAGTVTMAATGPTTIEASFGGTIASGASATFYLSGSVWRTI